MKKRIFIVASCLTSFVTFSQQDVTGTQPAENTNARALAAWYRGGILNSSSSNNIFGTLWNSPIYTQTAGITRTRLNGSLINNYFGYNHDDSGHFGTGLNNIYNDID